MLTDDNNMERLNKPVYCTIFLWVSELLDVVLVEVFGCCFCRMFSRFLWGGLFSELSVSERGLMWPCERPLLLSQRLDGIGLSTGWVTVSFTLHLLLMETPGIFSRSVRGLRFDTSKHSMQYVIHFILIDSTKCWRDSWPHRIHLLERKPLLPVWKH